MIDIGGRYVPGACRLPLLLAALLALTSSTAARAEETPQNLTTWTGYEGYHPFREGRPWGLMLEGYLKRSDFLAEDLSLFGRIGLNYQLANGNRLTGGYAFQYNYPYDSASEPYRWWDHRAWEQFTIRKPRGGRPGGLLQHRIRLEQRWLQRKQAPEYTETEQWKFEQTFRYMLRLNHPLSDRMFVAVYDEVHLRLPPPEGDKVFDQNRVYAGVGFWLDARRFWRLEAGYMFQSVWQSADTAEGRRRINHTIRFSVTTDQPFAMSGNEP
jgi:hypothetical protein